jgi:hypothetical protein
MLDKFCFCSSLAQALNLRRYRRAKIHPIGVNAKYRGDFVR